MKIQVIDSSSSRPLANTKIQLQIKGKDAGFLSVTSDASGFITLEDSLKGQQISATNSATSADASKAQFVTATEGAKLLVVTLTTETTTSGGRSSK